MRLKAYSTKRILKGMYLLNTNHIGVKYSLIVLKGGGGHLCHVFDFELIFTAGLLRKNEKVPIAINYHSV